MRPTSTLRVRACSSLLKKLDCGQPHAYASRVLRVPTGACEQRTCLHLLHHKPALSSCVLLRWFSKVL